MSSFMMKAKNKRTGESCEVLCMDNFFGHYQYGYEVLGGTGRVMNEDEFRQQYEEIKP